MVAEVKEVAKSGRPQIQVADGDLAGIVAAAQTALIEAGSEIFQRSGRLVRVAQFSPPRRTTRKGAFARTPGAHVIVQVTRENLTLQLAEKIEFVRHDGRSKKLASIDPPTKVAALMLESADASSFPHLSGLVPAPTLRADRSLLDAPGYDEQSCLYATFGADEFPKIDPKPSRAQALSALTMLREVFSETPFVNPAHASVALAHVVTACVRSALEFAPAFGYSATKQGSGKTLAASVAGLIVLGHDPTTMNEGDDEVELKKALFSTLMAGDSQILLDNIDNPIKSAALCVVLTRSTYNGRVLGETRIASVPTSVTVALTGNALSVVGDLTTRTLLCLIDPQMEFPERRVFKRNLVEYVLERRGELVRAALTIVLAYFAAGSPATGAEESRFKDWDQFVRFPLIWLGAADPLATQDELRADDPERDALVSVLHAWLEAFGGHHTTVAEAEKAATGYGKLARPELREALQAVAGEKVGDHVIINKKRLGRYLKRMKGRIEDGLRIAVAGKDPSTSRLRFCVIRVSQGHTREDVRTTERAMALENADNAVNEGSPPSDPSTSSKTNAGNAGNEGNCANCEGHGCPECTM